ncbi:hypothetical protein QYE76_008365 [Lolium multiflorum]|uniref:Retrotransposon protein, putative, Ty1-copia subclass n=1 Tax=Lolium multiflorum TaxID=4521 RepID=A0AAD8VDF6_LOLMU|nr:hypothetical protein QYE76_008365 [Lolium multiflorum]
MGYPKETIGYTFYHRSEGKIFVAKNGTFLEKEFLTKEVTGRKVELDEITESSLVDQSSAVPEVVPVPPAPSTEEANDNDHETSNEIATEPRRSTRERATPDWYDPCLNVMIVDNNDEDPATYEETMMNPDSNKWQEAMKSEIGSMYDNKVWTLVDLPDSRKAVENKWIFKRKIDADVVTMCSGGDGGDDDEDDDDGDGDDVQLDVGDDGVDFPLREGISPADFSLPESSFLAGVFRPAEAVVTPRDYPLGLRFSGRRCTRRRGGQRGLWAPSPHGGAGGLASAGRGGPRRPPRLPLAPLRLLEK